MIFRISIHILQVVRPIRMNTETPSGVPPYYPVFEFRVSESAQGPLIGRLRGYLDPSGKIFCEDVAVRILFLPIRFSRGVIQIRPPSGGSPTDQIQVGKYCPQPDCFPSQGRVSRRSGNTPKQGPEVSFPRRESYPKTPEGTMRRDLMNPATTLAEVPTWILVAKNPTDEALRQGRNPSLGLGSSGESFEKIQCRRIIYRLLKKGTEP